jgi:hypothetical protein
MTLPRKGSQLQMAARHCYAMKISMPLKSNNFLALFRKFRIVASILLFPVRPLIMASYRLVF